MNPRYLFDDHAQAGSFEFRRLHRGVALAVPVRRSLGDAPGGRTSLFGIYLGPAGNPHPHPGRRRRAQNRPSRLLPPQASRHALARRCGMDGGGGVALACPFVLWFILQRVGPSFRGDAKHRLEIPRCAMAHLRSGANAPSRNDNAIASKHTFAFPRRITPEPCKNPYASEGAGNAGCPMHPRPRV
jgi:hypothetical protein